MRERILSVAERLFAQHGIDGVSLRDIASEAEIQISLLSYYFTTKESLYRSVFERHFSAYSTERLASLKRIVAGTETTTARAILASLANPWIEFRSRRGGLSFTRLAARENSDPGEAQRGILKEFFDPIALEYIDALQSALPQVPRSTIHWAYHFFAGGLIWVLTNPDRIERLSGSACHVKSKKDLESAVDVLISVFANMLNAQVVK